MKLIYSLNNELLNRIHFKNNDEIIKKCRRIALSVLITVITIKWFYAGAFFYTDTHIPIGDISAYHQRMISVWDFVYGRGDVRHLLLLPYVVFVGFMSSIIKIIATDVQIKIQLIEASIFLLNSVAVVVGLEKLFYLLLREKKIKPNIRIEILIGVLTLFYLFNIWSINSLWRPFWPYIFHYSFFPLLLYSFLSCCENGSAKNYILMLITTIFVSIGYTIPFSIVFDLIILLTFSLTLKRKWAVAHSFILFIIFVIIAVFPALLVGIMYPSLAIAQAKSTTALAPISQLLEYNSPDILRGVGITGYPPFYNSDGMLWYSSTPYFSEPFYLMIYALFLLLPIVLSKRISHNMSLSILFVLYMTFLTLLNNNKAPFPFNIITTNLLSQEFLQLLRSTYTRFGEYLVILFVLITFLSWSALNSNNKRKYTYFSLIVLFFFAVILPFVTTSYTLQAWENYGTNVAPIHTQIPKEYKYLLTELSSVSKENDNLLIIPYPTSFQRMDWYQGPPLFVLGSYGKVILDDDTRLNVLSNIIDNTSIKLSGPYMIVYSQDTIPIKGTDIKLKNAFEALLSIPEFNSRFSRIEINNTSGKNIFFYKNEEFLSPFLALNDNRSYDVGTNRLLTVSQNKPILLTYSLPTYYSIVLKKDTFDKFSLSASFNVAANESRFNEIYIYPLLISYGQKEKNNTESIYIYLKIKAINDTEALLEVGDGKNWNYTKINSSIVAISNRSRLDFYYDGNINLNISNNPEIYIESKNVNGLKKELKEILKSNSYNSYFELQFRTANTNISDLFIDKWILEYKKQLTTPEDLYLSYGEELSRITIRDYIKLNPTHYKVKVNATQPFMLAFVESYDPLWHARVDKINGKAVKSEKVRTVPIYSIINGFWINETGDLNITIEYEPQKWFYIGAAISLITLILSILYLIYDWRKNQRTDSIIKTEQKPLKMPKIVTKTARAINDRSRLIIKRRSNPELKALRNHVVHNEYHYHKKKTIKDILEDLKEKLTKKKK